jgi:EAL domain-containing protein (putative c-di-GMP-specific phosphodiesterase class I)
LVPSDLSKSQIENNKLKYISLSLDSLRENVFRESKAKNIVFILDTCYSGSILPKERGGTHRDFQKQILDAFPETIPTGKHNQMRTIFVSSEPLAPSMEYAELKNGLFTHHILTGLRGGSVDRQSGEVTVGALFDYVKKHMPEEQKPGEYVHGYGSVVLVHHPKTTFDQSAIKYFSVSEIEKVSVHPELVPLTNSLEHYFSFIQSFIDHLGKDLQSALPDEEKIIDTLRLILKAEIGLVLYKQHNRWELRIKKQQINTRFEKFIEKAIPTLLAGIQAQSELLTSDRVGSFSHLNISAESMEAIAIPVNDKGSLKVVVFCGNTENLDFYKNDLFAQVISGVYYAFERTLFFDPIQLESHILDYLKMFHKYVPSSLYERRSILFKTRLEKMSVRFQPIIYLGMGIPFVCGFETLASDPITNKTPLDLMKAAELWGTRFKIDLDCHFFETGLATYKERLKATSGYRRPQDTLDISINVYPESLLRSAYYSKIAEMMGKQLIPNYKLYLEISEKSPSPEIVPGNGIAAKGMTSFRDILQKYVKDFKLGFAIDDFGVGHSSVARLGELTPSYIKIDRDLLKLETAYETIKFTVDYIEEIVSSKHLSSSKVVLEGFDEEILQTLSLSRLMKSGIQFIQSYIVGMPTDQLARLNHEQRDYIISLMKIKQ